MSNTTGGLTVKLPEKAAARQRKARSQTVILLALFCSAFFLDARAMDRWPEICLWRRLTGLACPFCGLTRSVVALCHGSLSLALAYHPLGPLVFLGGLLLLADSLYTWAAGSEHPFKAAHRGHIRWLATLLALAWLLWWVLRRLLLQN